MNPNCEVIKVNDTNIYYKVKSITLITDAFVDTMDWPDKISRLSFLFEKPIESELEILGRNISGKYSARLTYCADKIGLVIPELIDDRTDVELKILKSISELRRIYLETVKKTFSEEWPGKLPGERMKFSEKVAREYLSLEKSICLQSKRQTVGVSTFVRLTDYLGCPVDCVNWVWLDKALSVPERLKAQCLIAKWLKQTSGEKMNCYIDSFNWRSQRFFKRIGFKPVCLNIEKSS